MHKVVRNFLSLLRNLQQKNTDDTQNNLASHLLMCATSRNEQDGTKKNIAEPELCWVGSWQSHGTA